ncbi:MAG: hypothetical protein E4H36_00220 [Spirochaetales bacterium]|nr:MAG: hypothetical protein E4H36_00220 [Spirochaetales bacterium]
MEEANGFIRLYYTDDEINTAIKTSGPADENYTCHYSQNEDFFLKLKEPFTVPHMPIHHDVTQKKPSQEYIGLLRSFLKVLIAAVPGVFTNLTYFFDPGETLRPCFFQIYKTNSTLFLYLMRLNLLFKPQYGEITEKGTNDITQEYVTQNLFFEADIIPLTDVVVESSKVKGFNISRTVSETWIGETGRGYFVQGIWMDNELTKFFTRLFLPPGKRIYPYYPFICKFRTICHTPIDFSPEGRKRHLSLFGKAMDFILPEMDTIQEALRHNEFSEELEAFKDLYKRVPEDLKGPWQRVSVERYLNEQDFREFTIKYAD